MSVPVPTAKAEALLALCARPSSLEPQLERIRALTTDPRVWEGLSARAEQEGLAPLVRMHLTAAGVRPPQDTERQLSGLWMRHKAWTAARERVLVDVLTAMARESIEVMLLKGAALSRVVYSEPMLRPMRDIDLLVRAADLPRAEATLKALGFAAHEDYSADHHHMEPLWITRDGLHIGVELHRSLERARRAELESFRDEAMDVGVGGVSARCLGPLPMLRHVYLHGFCLPMHRAESFRLIWAADLIGVVETFADRMDWTQLAEQDPQLLRALPWFGCLTPWAPHLSTRIAAAPPLEALREPLSEVAPRAVAAGLPRTSAPDVWLGIRYGLHSTRELPWTRSRHTWAVLRDRLGWGDS